jgi:hypothetical protein
MTLYSRITGKSAGVPAGPMLPSCFTNAANSNERLVPDSKRAQADAHFCCPWPDAADLRTLEQIVEVPTSTWHEWTRRSPLVPNVTDAVQLTHVEQCLQGNLKHLQEVFRQPAQHLRTVRERLPISQARRVPEAAIPDLIAHPEDWERRTARGIRPLRLLSQRVEDDLDLYENRVAVRLVDGLLKDLLPRIRTLRQLSLLQRAGQGHHVAQQGSHWRTDRLYELWGAVFRDASSVDKVAATLADLERLRRALLALQDMPLYSSVTRKAELPAGLRPTNILNNHPEYRKVAEIWRQWVAAQEPELSPTERLTQRRRESAAFDRFGLLLVLRAMRDLGWSAEGADAVRAGSQLLLQRHGMALRMSLDPDGAVTLSMDEQRLRIVPVLCAVTPEHRSIIANSIRAEADSDVLVLLLGQPEQLLEGTADGDGTPGATPDADTRMLAGWGRPTVLLVSPFTLDSQERVARALSSWLAHHALPSYPPRLPLNADAGVTLPRWLRASADRIEAVEPASEAEIAAFRAQCESRRRALETEARRMRGRGTVDPRQAALDNLLLAAQHAATLRVLQQCQVCGGTARFEPRLDGGKPTWWCRCQACDAEWGTRPCSGCQEPFPVLIAEPDLWPDDRAADWLDRSFGRDLWSEPCWDPQRPGAFRCSHCGNCGRDGACDACAPHGDALRTSPSPDASP